jgi:DNA repair protein RecN (Recombination protein N)
VREHVELLDRYAGHGALRAEMAALVSAVRQTRASLAALRRDERELARRIDLLRYQVRGDRRARAGAGRGGGTGGRAPSAWPTPSRSAPGHRGDAGLDEGGEEQTPPSTCWGRRRSALARLARIDPTLDPQRQQIEELSYQLSDLAREVRRYRDRVEFNPGRLAEVEERLELIHNLKRKYGDSIEEIWPSAERAAGGAGQHHPQRGAHRGAANRRRKRLLQARSGEVGQRCQRAA